MENVKITPNERPHLQFKEDGPFDHFAFNALCVQGSIAGIHAGNKRIFIYQSEMETVNGSGPMKALQAQGWTFYPVNVEKPK
jgi:hypothetical protein